MTDKFTLSDENYYTAEADMAYMSCSQYQGFMACEARQMAKLRGKWTDEPKEAFLVGNYLHSYFESESAHDRFIKDNFDSIFKTKKQKTGIEVTGKYSAFERADKMIAVMENDELIQRFLRLEGKNEMFMTGEIFSIPWRIKMDKYVADSRYIIDYKTVANIWETSYNPASGTRETFIESYGYMFRASVYSLIEAQNIAGFSFEDAYAGLCDGELTLPMFFLICVSKQDYPDKEIINVNHRQGYIRELEGIKDKLQYISMLKNGRAMPKRCGTCDYCRATKKLSAVRPFYELMPEFRAEREVDYNAETFMVETQIS